MKFLAIFFFSFVLLPLGLLAQARGNARYDRDPYRKDPSGFQPKLSWQGDQVLSVKVKGLSNQKPDSLVAIFAILQVGETAEQAEQFLRERVEAFRTNLRPLGLKPEDVYVDMVSFVPAYEFEVEKKIFSKTYNEVPKGFELQQNVHLKFKDARLLPAIIQAAAKSELYELAKVEYFVDNVDKIYLDLQKKCLEHAMQTAKTWEAVGIKVDTLSRALHQARQAFFPFDRYASYQAYALPSVENLKKGSKVQSSTRKPNISYYDKIAYDDFDVIINPLVHEPVVQYVYELELRFYLPSPRPAVPQPSRELYWLSPQGTLQKIPNP